MTTRNARTNSLKAIVAAGLLAMPGMALADVNAAINDGKEHPSHLSKQHGLFDIEIAYLVRPV